MTSRLRLYRVSNRTLQSKGILNVIEKAYRSIGPMFTLKFENDSEILVLASHRHVEYWLRHNDHFTKEMDDTRASSALGRIQLGESLTFARDGEEWSRLRTLTMSIVNPKNPKLMQANQQAAHWFSKCFEDCSVIDDVWPLCLDWATRCVLVPYLGNQTSVDTSISVLRKHQEVFFHLVEKAEYQTKVDLYLDPQVHAFRAEIAKILDTAFSHPDYDVSGLLGTLAERLDIKNNPEQKSFLSYFLMGNLLGSVDNPASALLWCLIYLSRHPEVIVQIRQESYEINLNEWSIQRYPVTMAAVKESLRLSPVQPLLERFTSRNIDLDCISIAKGTHVLFCPWLIHRDPLCWPRPWEFDINRFLQSKRIDPAKYFPFGVGPRICAGMNLTFNQLIMCLLSLCRSHDWSINEAVTSLQLRPEFKLNLKPRGPISFNINKEKN